MMSDEYESSSDIDDSSIHDDGAAVVAQPSASTALASSSSLHQSSSSHSPSPARAASVVVGGASSSSVGGGGGGVYDVLGGFGTSVRRREDSDDDHDDMPQKKLKGSSPGQKVIQQHQQQQDFSGGAGSSCHQCKSRRNHADLIFCTNVVDKKNKGCRKKYCDHCLKKFYHEDVGEIPDKENWSCPSCRKLCCCAACRRKEQKDRPLQYGYDNTLPFFPHGVPSTSGAGAASGLQESAHSSSSNTSETLSEKFQVLYAVAQTPDMQKVISDILARRDLPDPEKVESIANLLRSAAGGGHRSLHRR
eukprot:TRINITY_DN4100_c0_g1_i1.p1 TRINITY_DN4100_c0_g1~~TRINITY_DN4100_c0_g1_i1.p1  ORF type:complete len:305 (+),score=79.19 TRINITY_DN4100_c0_g1_i1:324-1238(+)